MYESRPPEIGTISGERDHPVLTGCEGMHAGVLPAVDYLGMWMAEGRMAAYGDDGVLRVCGGDEFG